jgi:hypothetical protein
MALTSVVKMENYRLNWEQALIWVILSTNKVRFGKQIINVDEIAPVELPKSSCIIKFLS